MASTLFCGWRQGVLVWLLSVLTAWYAFIPPFYSFEIAADGVVALIGFALVGGFDVLMLAALTELVRRLEAAKRMQESLLRELQHRVANNMQIVLSMLRNARRGLPEGSAVDNIHRAERHLAAMARLHRRLCDTSAYLNGLDVILREALADTFHDLPVRIKVAVSTEDLSVDQMTSIVLLVNEAAINALKHVYRKGLGTTFEVSLSEQRSGRLRLLIRDDGPGIAPVASAGAQTLSFGMTIMRSFAHQLGGSLEVLDGPGATLSVEFASA
jgi:two-component sensor histidine kinase